MVIVFNFSHESFAQQKNLPKETDEAQGRANIWAIETGEVAGAAVFCEIEKDILENYITRAQAKIATESHSDVDLVVARITFTNTMNTTSIKAPAEGCKAFGERFERESLRLN